MGGRISLIPERVLAYEVSTYRFSMVAANVNTVNSGAYNGWIC